MSYIIYDDYRIIDAVPHYQIVNDRLIEVPIAKVMANYPSDAKIEKVDADLELIDAKRLYRVVDGKLLLRPVIDVIIEPNVITGDGVDSALVQVFIENYKEDEKATAITFTIGTQEKKTVVVPLDENMRGSAQVSLTEKGLHLLELGDGWPQAVYLPQALLVV